MKGRFNFMKQNFNVEKTQKYRGKIFRTRHFSKEGGTPLWKNQKNRVNLLQPLAPRHIDVVRRSDKGSTYVGRGRGRGYIGRPISYKIKLNFIFARKTLIFFIKTI